MGCRLPTKFSGGTLTHQHAGAPASAWSTMTRPPATEHFMPNRLAETPGQAIGAEPGILPNGHCFEPAPGIWRFMPHDVHLDLDVAAGGIQLEHRGHRSPKDKGPLELSGWEWFSPIVLRLTRSSQSRTARTEGQQSSGAPRFQPQSVQSGPAVSSESLSLKL